MQICILTVLSASQTSTKAKPNNSFIWRKSVHCQIRNVYANAVTSNINKYKLATKFCIHLKDLLQGLD